MAQVEIAKITYNAATGAFEARVDISAGGRRFRYPCAVAGPVDLDLGFVRKSLKRQAINMSDTGGNLLSKI